jgi:DNA-binding transcriptional LysR family regulator
MGRGVIIMELLQLRYFADAAKTENFSHTANKHLVPPSTVSQAIKKLETELGVSLFERNGNKVILNENGAILHRGIENALRDLDDAILALKDNTKDITGDICLCILTNRRLVTECISDFKKIYPNVNFSLYHDHYGVDYNKFDLWIDDRTLDINDAEKELLVSENIYVAVSKDHPLAKKKSVTMRELSTERFISMTSNRSLHKILVSECRQLGFEPKIAIQCDDPYYVRMYVSMNYGITLFPEFSWRKMFTEDAAILEIQDRKIKRDTYVYWRASKYLSNASKAFRSYLIEQFAYETRRN